MAQLTLRRGLVEYWDRCRGGLLPEGHRKGGDGGLFKLVATGGR